jgi:stage III sporulation protein AG
MSKKGWFSQFKGLFGNGKEDEKRVKPIQLFVILGGVGAALMILSSFHTATTGIASPPTNGTNGTDQPAFANKSKAGDTSIADSERAIENQLKDILEEVVGVGQVSVMVNLDSSEEMVVEKDTNVRSQTTKEVDKEKATRDTVDSSQEEKVVILKNDQGEQPIVVQRIKPKVRGVLIVAKGAENMRVKAAILEAVERALHVEPHKISILPKKG